MCWREFFFKKHLTVTIATIMILTLITVNFTIVTLNPATLETIETQQSFTGTLTSSTHQHGWFGIGTTGTTMSFINNTETVNFISPNDLQLTLGKTYNVTFTEQKSIWHDQNNFYSERPIFGTVVQNRTTLSFENAIIYGSEQP